MSDIGIRYGIKVLHQVLDSRSHLSVIGAYIRADDLKVMWERDQLMVEANLRGMTWPKYPIKKVAKPRLKIVTFRAPVNRRWGTDLLSQLAKGNLLRPRGQIIG